jgi:hypothetical protein
MCAKSWRKKGASKRSKVERQTYLNNMNPFLKFLTSRLAQRQLRAGTHPDADLLAAFREKTLGTLESSRVLAHLGICAECREVVALASAGAAEIAETAHKTGRRLGWWHLRWVAALAAACMVTLLVWLKTEAVNNPTVGKPAISAEAELTIRKQSFDSATANPKLPAPTVSRKRPKAAFKSLPAPLADRTPITQLPEMQTEARQEMFQANSTVKPQATPPAPQMLTNHAFKQGALPQAAFAPAKALSPGSPQQSLWSISPDAGMLWKSDDGGKTGRAIFVDGRTNFLALSVLGTNVWAGGEGGMLFHSTDDGSHWTVVPVSDGEERLSETITGIETHGPKVLKLRTKMAGWVSANGGVGWRKE